MAYTWEEFAQNADTREMPPETLAEMRRSFAEVNRAASQK